MVDLVKKWKEVARRDDLFDNMVPSDVRMLVKEIERLQKIEKDYIKLMRILRAASQHWTED